MVSWFHGFMVSWFHCFIVSLFHCSKYQVNAPSNNPLSETSPKETLEVTDPAHPLFGRRFLIISVSRPPSGEAHAIVESGHDIALKIPVCCTSLEPSGFCLSTKLSLSSLKAFIQLLTDYEELCHIDLTKSIETCRPVCKKKSDKKS